MTDRMGSLEEIDRVVSELRSLAARSPDRYRRQLAFALVEFAGALQGEYGRTWDIDVLDRQIKSLEEAAGYTEQVGLDRPALLSSIGNARLLRFEHLGQLDDLDAAVRMQREAIAAAPPDDSAWPALMVNLGAALKAHAARTGDLDSLDEAIAVLRRAVAAPKADAPHFVFRSTHLGAALRARYERTGDIEDLLEAERLLDSAQTTAPPDSGDYGAWLAARADVAYDLAEASQDRGRLTDAEDRYRALHRHRTERLGTDHPDTLASLNSLVIVLAQQGNNAEAASAFEEVVERQTRVLGAEHPDTLASRANLASMWAQMDLPHEAERAFRSVLEAATRVLGPDHPEVLAVRHKLASLLLAQGRHREAEADLHELVRDLDRVAGPRHSETLSAQRKLWEAQAVRRSSSGRIIMVTDIEHFSSRTYRGQLATNQALFEVLENVLERSGVKLTACVVEDRGDGVLVVLPPDTQPHEFVDGLLRHLRPTLGSLNAPRPLDDRLRLRIVLHVGAVENDDHGFVGDDLMLAYRLLDSRELRDQLTRMPDDFVVAVSQQIHSSMQTPDRDDNGSFQMFEATLRTGKKTAWVWLPPDPGRDDPNQLRHQTHTERTRGEVLRHLTDAFLAVPGMANLEHRQVVIDLLPLNIATVIQRHSRARLDVMSIVGSCLAYQGGLEALVAAVSVLEQDSLPLAQLRNVVARLHEEVSGERLT